MSDKERQTLEFNVNVRLISKNKRRWYLVKHYLLQFGKYSIAFAATLWFVGTFMLAITPLAKVGTKLGTLTNDNIQSIMTTFKLMFVAPFAAAGTAMLVYVSFDFVNYLGMKSRRNTDE